jgi:hypothetical protein
MTNLLMVIGCVLGVIGGAAPSTEKMWGLPIDWTLAVLGSLFLLAAFFARRAGARPADATATGKGSIGAAREAIQRTTADVRKLLERARDLPIDELARDTNDLIERDLNPVIEAQDLLMRSQGFAKYAAHTGPWAAGERMVYRAWSAATDGHRPEAIASLREAIPHFDEATKSFA